MFRRIIPVLLLSDGGLVKSKNFQDCRYVGDALNAVRIFSEKEADELVFLDIEATRRGASPDIEMIKAIASEAYMPFAYGGGVRTLQQAENILRNGAEKIVLNDAIFSIPHIVEEMTKEFGSQAVVACIDVKRIIFGKYAIFSYKDRTLRKPDLVTSISLCENLGCGEIIVQSVDHDGQRTGYDVPSIQRTRKATSLPLVALGGARSVEDFRAAFQAGADAVAAGSMFIFWGKYQAVLINYPTSQEIRSILHADMH
ncbi:MAG: AglZ/HisF2 family acetamidino modification protein [Holosporales bacterium]|jgi:cyclase|nr:AglZ/HisF2 family acetamidino modification protein [Holosporales bacterium]